MQPEPKAPDTVEEWYARISRLTSHVDAAHAELSRAQREYKEWRESPTQVLAAWAPIAARLSRELGADFSVEHNGGGTFALRGIYAGVTVTVTDWLDGDLSHPEAGTGWWVGFSLADAPWTGVTESMVGDPDARGLDGLVKLVAYAVSDYLRGNRHPCVALAEHDVARINYYVEQPV